MFNNNVFKSWHLRGVMKNNCGSGKLTDNNMAHAHCMLVTYGYKHTLRICNNYLFSTTTMVALKIPR
jgi:hypothetical protein